MRQIRSRLVVGAAIGGAAIGGAAIASAATSSTTTSSSSTTPSATAGAPSANFPAHGSAAHEDAEKPVTGTAGAKARAAAVKSLGGGTAGEVTTDFTQKGYEVTITKSDGSKVEVHLDSSFRVMQGGPGGHGPGGDGPGAHGPWGGNGSAPPAGAPGYSG